MLNLNEYLKSPIENAFEPKENFNKIGRAWTDIEKERLEQALKFYHNDDYKAIALFIGTRSKESVRLQITTKAKLEQRR